jgi:hypothetical protein
VTLTETIKEIASLRSELSAHEAAAKARSAEITDQIRGLNRAVALEGALIDRAKVDLARTVLSIRGAYSRAGDDRGSVIQDAVAFFATGPKPYKDLRQGYFGTKNYDRWSGQRSDHPYGMGPSHGSICFDIGLVKAAREKQSFTPEEVEACLYFLTRIEAIQNAEIAASAA